MTGKILFISVYFLFIWPSIFPSKIQAQEFSLEKGPAQKVSYTKCQSFNTPDTPARAFIDYQNNVQLVFSQTAYWRTIGNNLDEINTVCDNTAFSSHLNATPRMYDDYEWFASPYTLDGLNIYALVHTEYHGYAHNNCKYTVSGDLWKCWWNSVNLAFSNNGGATYTHTSPPNQNIASSPVDYNINNDSNFKGFFEPSGIISKDGYYYALVNSLNNGGADGACVMRTTNLADPKSWRLWDGKGFNLTGDRALCKPVIPFTNGQINPHFYLGYSSYLEKYIASDCRTDVNPPGCAYVLSSDLINWSTETRFVSVTGNINWGNTCSYAAFIQPGDPTRNFEKIGRSPWMYFSSDETNSGCDFGPDGTRETLYRQRIRFSKAEDAGKYEMLDLQFNEKKGTKALDSSFYGNNGSLNGGIIFQEKNGINMVNIYNGANVEIPHNSSLNASGQMTIEANIRVGSVPSNGTFPAILRKEDAGNRNYGFYLTDIGKLHFSLQKGIGQELVGFISNRSIVDGNWHKVAVTYDNAIQTAAFFIDGVFDSNSILGANLGEAVNTASAYIGDQEFSGDIDYVTLLNYAKYQIPILLPTPSPTQTPSPTNTSTPTPTIVSTPTPTVIITITPTPFKLEFMGVKLGQTFSSQTFDIFVIIKYILRIR
jgi:hypothetical protein